MTRASAKHAQRIRTCDRCGRKLRGNGGWSSHRKACSQRTLAVFMVNDHWGGGGMKPPEEFERQADHLEAMLRVRTKRLGRGETFQDVPEGVDVLFFDYGGMAGAYGTNVFADRCGEVVRWAEDHPSALVLVTSSYTWDVGGFEHGEVARMLKREHAIPANVMPTHNWRVGAGDEWVPIRAWLGLPER